MNGKLKESELNKIISALIKRAVGYYDEEVLEEYVVEGDENKLVKKKVTRKYIAPDLSASKLLLDYFNKTPDGNYDNMNDAELDAEADRLYQEYQDLKKQNTISKEDYL